MSTGAGSNGGSGTDETGSTPVLHTEVLDGAFVVPAHVVFRDFIEETVVLNLSTGTYHGLNRTAGEILRGIEAGSLPRAVAARIAQEYQQELALVERDVADLCAALLTRTLIERCVDSDS